ncbi:MAG TPA: DUF6265 family protein [Vicinamibacteria bacterium]|nr:DUF6265 family protein [Vicinamibacteria bacterium]
MKLFLAVVASAFAAMSNDLEGLRFMEGDWRGESGKARIEEHWIEAAGGIMLGVSRTIVSGKTVAFEFLRIEAREDGVFYVAQPNGRPGTDFKLTQVSAGEAVFENPQHDHPKLIRYRLGDDTLVAEVEGDEGKQEFRFRKSSAP